MKKPQPPPLQGVGRQPKAAYPSNMKPLIVRPARHEDMPGLLALAAEAGTGMTTVPQTEEAMGARIEASLGAFAGKGMAAAKDVFFFVLDDGDGAIGMASIFPKLGEERPFYSYRLSHIAAQAPAVNLSASSDVLFLVNDFHGYTEVGTLLVGKRARGRGAGRLLSLSRFMFMGTRNDRFGPDVMAEIRGWFDEKDNSPFWEQIAAKFFNITFEEADRLSANDFRFISHLMPKFPIYVSLLPPEARAVIGKPHETSALAMGMLQSEGFAWSRCIDIFDGGPSIECPLGRIRTVKDSQSRSVTVSDTDDHIGNSEPFLIASPGDAPYVAVLGTGHREGGTVVLSPETAERADFRNGAHVIASPLKG